MPNQRTSKKNPPSPPSLSDVLDMQQFSILEIVASDGSEQEVLEEGDW